MKYINWNNSYLEQLVDLWNEELGDKFPMQKKLFRQNSFLDENVCPDTSRIVINEQNDLIGFVISKRWQEKLDVEMRMKTGWIQAILVHKDYRNRGIGSTLLSYVEDIMKKTGMEEILLGKDPWHYFPGIPDEYQDTIQWFEKRGYENFGKEYDLINKYTSTENLSIPKAKDAEFSVLESKDKDDLIAFLNRCFPGRWEYEAIKYFEKGGTGREFVVLKKHGEIIGFCRMNDSQSPLIAQNVYWSPLFDEELGGIGPLGVDSEERGNGYGLGIVEAAIAFLRNRRINRIVIDWTGLVDFYGKLGYEPWKSYHSYRKVF